MAVTAKRNGMRLLAIVLGESNGKIRNQETAELLDYGFNLYLNGEYNSNNFSVQIERFKLDSILEFRV